MSSAPSKAAAVAAALLLQVPAPAIGEPVTVTVHGRDGKPLPDAVIGVLLRGQHTSTTSTTVQLAQRERQFLPSVSVLQTGTAMQLPNFDTVRHHVYSFSPIKRFEIKLYSGTPAAPVVFDKPGVATLGCNIHDRMTAWVVVMSTPVFGRSNAAGEVLFDLPAGEHLLQGWHAGMPDGAEFTQQRVSVGTGRLQVGITLPASGQR